MLTITITCDNLLHHHQLIDFPRAEVLNKPRLNVCTSIKEDLHNTLLITMDGVDDLLCCPTSIAMKSINEIHVIAFLPRRN